MKILILDIYYRYFTDKFYRDNPKARLLSYRQQLKKITDEIFGTADFYSKNLVPLGYQAQEVILNNFILQHQWAGEHGDSRIIDYIYHVPLLRKYVRPDWQKAILTKQIIDFQPDILYCQDLNIPGPEYLRHLKKFLPVKVVGQIASPTNFVTDKFSPYDLILTSFPHYVPEFQKLGIKCAYFKIGFEPTILKKLHKNNKPYPVSFVGGFSQYHQKAYETMEWVAGRTHIDFWGYGYNTLAPDSAILKNYHGEAWGEDMYEILYNSKITLNRHIEVAKNNANNMRLFEATGVGSMLITDYKDNLKDLFIPGKEVETYKTKEELLEKIQYYLTHEPERAAIAKAGQKRTLKDHTYKIRMKELDVIFKKLVKT